MYCSEYAKKGVVRFNDVILVDSQRKVSNQNAAEPMSAVGGRQQTLDGHPEHPSEHV